MRRQAGPQSMASNWWMNGNFLINAIKNNSTKIEIIYEKHCP